MTRRSIRTLAVVLTLAACGDTPVERSTSGAGIGAGTALALGASMPWGLALGAGAGYFSR
jgi:osmotically inducible lipoprotein OsmB